MQAQVNAVLMIAVRAGPKAREIAVVSGWVAIKDRILMITPTPTIKTPQPSTRSWRTRRMH
jgi:hypothetical protein